MPTVAQNVRYPWKIGSHRGGVKRTRWTHFGRTANWRRGLQAKYPNDPRNGRAAEKLDQLADETNDLTDEAWSELVPFYNWASGTWSDAVSQASRRVVFQRNVRTFPAFVNNLVGILSEQHVSN